MRTTTICAAAPASTRAYFFGESVLVDLEEGFATGGNSDGGVIGDDRLSGIENIFGTAGGDLIGGNGVANMLVGSSGGDVLIGRGGADRFVYHNTDDSAPKFSDRILDFSRSQGDRIDLAIIDANEQASGNQAFQLIGQSQFTAAGQLRCYQQNSDTVIEANTTDLTAGAEMIIVLDPLATSKAPTFSCSRLVRLVGLGRLGRAVPVA